MNWVDIAIREANKRRRIFNELDKYLEWVKSEVKSIDPDAEVYLFGSVLRGEHLLSSDIDILVVTELKPGYVISELWRRGVKEPFEIHIASREEFRRFWYRVDMRRI